jgi:hypothetical protein
MNIVNISTHQPPKEIEKPTIIRKTIKILVDAAPKEIFVVPVPVCVPVPDPDFLVKKEKNEKE